MSTRAQKITLLRTQARRLRAAVEHSGRWLRAAPPLNAAPPDFIDVEALAGDLEYMASQLEAELEAEERVS